MNIHTIKYFFTKSLKRKILFFFQRRIRGFDDSDLWPLDNTIAKLILPRLKRFRKMTCAYPTDCNSIDEWFVLIDKMIYSFEFISTDKLYTCHDTSEWDKVNEGLDIFRKYYFDLWW